MARESSQPHVEAWGSSQPHVEARGSSQPHVVARGSSQPHVEARESSQLHVVAWESSQLHVVARESSQLHVIARESSQPHVEARESSQLHVEAWESSRPHVVAWGYAQLSLFGAVFATLSARCSALIHGTGAEVKGGRQICVRFKTVQDWCDYYGVEIKNGVAILYKALNDDFTSPYGLSYAPGSQPVAPDWDGGQVECGGGLHFSPSPAMAMEFHASATKYVGCPVAVHECAVNPDGAYPQKVKAKRCCGPVFEVDRIGKRK